MVALTERGEYDGSRGRAVEDEKHVAFGLEHLRQTTFRLRGERVVAVTRHAAGVGRGQRCERLRADARGVVAGKRIVVAHRGHGDFRVWQRAPRAVSLRTHVMNPADVNLY